MAREIKPGEISFRGRNTKDAYDWASVAESPHGQVLSVKDDLNGQKIGTVKNNARTWARKHEMGVRTRELDDGKELAVEFFKDADAPSAGTRGEPATDEDA